MVVRAVGGPATGSYTRSNDTGDGWTIGAGTVALSGTPKRVFYTETVGFRGLHVEAHEEAKNRLVVWRIARQIRLDRRLPEGEVVRVTLHDRDGRVLFEMGGQLKTTRHVTPPPDDPESEGRRRQGARDSLR